MAVAKIRDIFAFSSFIILFSIMAMEQVTSGDTQWDNGTELLAPMYYVAVFSLCGAFFIRSNFFKMIAAIGPKYSTMDKSDLVKKRIWRLRFASCIFVVLTLFIFSEGLNHGQDSFEWVEFAENDDGTYNKSSLVSESDIITECNHNEECVAANILDDSFLFFFLAPDTMEFEEGDPTDYHETIGIFFPLFLLTICWFYVVLFSGIYEFLFRKKPNSQTSDVLWREYYDKKSYHSYGAFLICMSSLFPSIFLFSNQSQGLTFSGGMILICVLVLFYYIGLYFYSYHHNDFFDPKVSEGYAYAPAFLMTAALLVAFIYGLFEAPVENVSDIWLYNWIVGFEVTFFFEDESYRYILLDLCLSGLVIILMSFLIIYVIGEDSGWFWIPALYSLIGAFAILLSAYGFLAMIVIEVVSLNLVWISPIILTIALGLTCFLLIFNEEISVQYQNLAIPASNSGLEWLSSQGQKNFAQASNQSRKSRSNQVQKGNQKKNPQHLTKRPDGEMRQALVEFPQWSEDEIQGFFDLGWTVDSLRDWEKQTKNLPKPIHKVKQKQVPPKVSAPKIPIDLSTEMLYSQPVVTEKPRSITVDSKGITIIETGFSKVTLNKLTTEVTKIPQGTDQHEMFIQEIKNMIHLDSKGFDVGLIDYDHGVNPKIVTRYMGPSKLSDHYKTLSARGKKKMMEELLEQVAQIHKCGMVHRDLKPDNILVDARPRDGNHQFDAIIDYGIAMKINRKQIESYNTAATKFFGHPSQKESNFNASTGQDWFSLARIFALIIRGVDIDSLHAEIQISQTGLEMRNDISSLGFNDSVTKSISDLIIFATNPQCDDNATIGKLAKTGKALSKLF